MGSVSCPAPSEIASCHAATEMSGLTFPPSKDEELPAMVHAQVLGRSAALGEEPVIDFVPLGDAEHEQREVEAMATTAETVASYQSFVAESGLRLQRLIPRPMATRLRR